MRIKWLSICLIFLILLQVSTISISSFKEKDRTDSTIAVAGRFHVNFFSIYGGFEEWKIPIYAGLYTRDTESLKWIPELAASDIEMLEDGSFRVQIKPDLKFSNGDSLTAEDVVFTYKTFSDPDVWTNYDNDIQNYFTTDSFTIEDDLTITFDPITDLFNPHLILSYPIVSQKFFQPLYDECQSNPIRENCDWMNVDETKENLGFLTTAGPYKLVDIKIIDSNTVDLHYKKNEYYWNTSSEMAEELIFYGRFDEQQLFDEFNAGNIDILLYSIVQLHGADIDGVRVTRPSTTIEALYPNHLHPYVGTGEMIPGMSQQSEDTQRAAANKVRKAIAHMFDPAALEFVNENAWNIRAYRTSSPIPEAVRGWNDTFPIRDFNVSRAKLYLEEAGFNFDNLVYDETTGEYETFFFDFTCLDANNGGSQYYDNFQWTFIEGLKHIGINGSVELLSFNEYTPLIFYNDENPPIYDDGGYDCTILSSRTSHEFNPGYQYHEKGLSSNWGEGYPNIINYINTTTEQIIDEYLDNAPLNNVADNISLVQKALYDDLPTIPLFTSEYTLYYQDYLTVHNNFAAQDNLKYHLIRSPTWETEDPTYSDDVLLDPNIVSLQLSMVMMILVYRRRILK